MVSVLPVAKPKLVLQVPREALWGNYIHCYHCHITVLTDYFRGRSKDKNMTCLSLSESLKIASGNYRLDHLKTKKV